jgi:hypothetical protein
MNKAINGRYQDVLRNAQGRLLWQSGWRSNRILNNCSRLLAALMKGEAGIQGLRYWAVGQGERRWDATLPNPQLASTQLTSELVRLPLSAEQITYIDSQNAPSATPTNRLQVTVDIDGSTLVSSGFQPLREFGLFGGDATETANSGLMINQVIHPRIDIAPDMTLSRTLHLTFMAEAVRFPGAPIQPLPTPSPSGPRATLPIISIDGVGEQYTADLAAAGITTVAALAQLDPRRPIGNIPEGKLREFRAKARLVLNLPSDLGALSPLAKVTVVDFLRQAANHLIRGIATPGVTVEAVAQWQARLESVQMALDEAQLQKMTLGELVST